MKILLAHNFYGSEAPSGENVVFEAEKSLLEKQGHVVQAFTRHSDEIRSRGLSGLIKGAAAVPWNPFAARELLRQVEVFQPDVVHVHNTFPLISPAIFHAIGSRAATVLTLHNYRLLCPAGIPMRNGKVCTDCIKHRSIVPALRYGCYRNSRLATLPIAASVAFHRKIGTWRNKVDTFIALSEFQKTIMVSGGLPQHKIQVKPNFYVGNPELVPLEERPNQIVFVGRLGEEKGVRTLVSAWCLWGKGAPLLRLIGDGPLRSELEKQARGLRIEFLGQMSSEATRHQIASSRLLILPSEWFEGFPLVITEAFAFGTPAAVSDLGPLPDIVRHGTSGVVFDPANATSLLQTVRDAWNAPELLARLADGARSEFEARYNEQSNYEMLLNIYQQAIDRCKKET